jgi:hypothetical protein
MDAEKAQRDLRVVRELMQRPVRYSTQSGLAAILAGVIALFGLWADAVIYARYPLRTAFWYNLGIWAGVLAAAVAVVLALTRLREKRRGMPPWSPVKKRILLTILPPFLVAVGLTAAIMWRWYHGIGPNEWGMIPVLWMCLYGLACWQVGEFSVTEMRLLGVVFLVSGVACAFFFQGFVRVGPLLITPYRTLGATFGGYHIVYGLIVYARHGG